MSAINTKIKTIILTASARQSCLPVEAAVAAVAHPLFPPDQPAQVATAALLKTAAQAMPPPALPTTIMAIP